MPRDMQTAMSGGELSPSLHSHADLGKYNTGLALCENWFVLAQGGVTTRPGFQYISEIQDSADLARLIPFQFNTEQTYVLVFTDQTMRVIKDGGMVLEATVNITGATSANPIVITATAHGYANGDGVYITGVTGMAEVNGRFFTVANQTSNTFELSGIDGTGYATYTSGGTVARVYTLTTPWSDSDLFRLKYTQSADTMTISHPSYDTRDLTRSAHDNWSITAISFAASISPPSAGLAIVQVGTASGSPNKDYRYVVTSVSSSGDESVASSIQTSGAINALNTTYGNQLSWNTVVGAAYYNVYKEFSLNSGIFGWVGEAGDGGSPQFRDYNFGPDMSVTPPVANNPFNGADNRPSCVTYHQQRKVFGASNNNPQTVWATRTADFDNMDYSRPLRADDSITVTLAAREVNEIRHLLSLDDLLVFTSGGEWRAAADADGVLTPLNFNFKSQGFRGSSHIPPLAVGETAIFVQEKGARVRDLNYTFEDDKYTGDDISIMARHLFEGYQIVDWCYSQEPYSIVWAVRDDGILLSLTYLREHQVFAWAKHTTDGLFESVCSVSEGDQDITYAVVRRTINGSDVRYVERLHERLFTDIKDAFCVDSGLTYTGPSYAISGATAANPVVITATGHGLIDGDTVWIRDALGMTELNGKQYLVSNKTANTFEAQSLSSQDIDGTSYTAYTSGGSAYYATKVITGLHHLEGEAVVALADGNVVPNLTVTNGSVSLPNAANKAHIGLGYSCDFQTLEVSFQGEVAQSRRKQVARVALRVLESRGLSVGGGTDSLYEFKERTPGMNYGDIPAQTAEEKLEITPSWTDYGQVYVRQAYPLPATVLAVIPEIVVSG